jgi:multidrug efflux system membrane fusion protein
MIIWDEALTSFILRLVQQITVIFALPEDGVEGMIHCLHAGALLQTALAKGYLTISDNQIDTTIGTLKLRAEFANEDETLFSNKFVNFRLLVDQLRDATVLPGAAIPEDVIVVDGVDKLRDGAIIDATPAAR